MPATLSGPSRRARRGAQPAAARAWAVRPQVLRVGFVRLVDAAPLIVAKELGFFARRQLEVTFSREVGWAAIRYRITFNELDIAHAPAPFPLAASLGRGGPTRACVTSMLLNLHGNAITLSNRLRDEGVRDGASLAAHIFSSRLRHPLTFAVVSHYASHHFLLCKWLRAHGINPKADVRLVVLPPEQMLRNLAAGHIDGFCVGEPWNSLTVAQSAGWCAATSAELDFGHPEKVLLATEEFAENRTEEYTAFTAAVLEACAWCDSAEGRARLPALLARPEHLDVPAPVIARSLQGPFNRGDGRLDPAGDFLIFHRFQANEPAAEKALWVLKNLAQADNLGEPDKKLREAALRAFRGDLYRAALRQAEISAPARG